MGVEIPCAGALIYDQHGRLLLIKRANPPAQGTWSLPGGRCEAGETSDQAAVREAHEETGLDVVAERLIGSVRRRAPGGETYVIDDWRCQLLGGTLAAGDDADDVAWFSREDLSDAELSPGLVEALDEWDALPSSASASP